MKNASTFRQLSSIALLIASFSIPSAYAADADSSWQFEVTPYLWGASFGYNTSINTDSDTSSDGESFFSLDNLDAVASVGFEARKQRWSLLFDGLYTKFSDDYKVLNKNANLTIKLGFIDVAAGYQLLKNKDISIIAGGRQIYINPEIDINPGASDGAKLNWLDPFIGLKGTLPVSEHWSVSARTDIGGGNDARLVYNNQFNVNYQMTKSASLKLGYRYMKMDLKNDQLVQSLNLNGLYGGVGIKF